MTIRPTFRSGAYWMAFFLLVDWLLTWMLLTIWPEFIVERNPFVITMGPWLHALYSSGIALVLIRCAHLLDPREKCPWLMVPVLIWYAWLMLSNASWLVAMVGTFGLET